MLTVSECQQLNKATQSNKFQALWNYRDNYFNKLQWADKL